MLYYLRMHADTKMLGAPEPFPDHVEMAAEVLRLLSDATRIRLVLALHRDEELPVNALAEAVDRKPAAVSQHLAKMRMARMVTTRHEGTRVLYRLTDEHAVTLVLEAIRQAEHSAGPGQPLRHTHAPRD